MKILQTSLIATIIIIYSSLAWSDCLSYEPSIVTLHGKLERRTYPGRPNYEDIENGDEPETGFYLILTSPVCVNGEESSPTLYPQSDVQVVQLVLDRNSYETFQKYLATEIDVSGQLFGSHTAHHHAPLLLNKVKLINKK